MTGNAELLEQALDEMAFSRPETRERLLREAGFAEAEADHQMIATGETLNDVYLVLQGHARALLYSEQGNEVWFNDFGPGDFFGEMAAIAELDRSADIYASTPLLTARFNAETFVEAMQGDAQFGFFITRQIVARFRKTSDRMFEVSALSAAGRIYAELLRIAEQGGQDDTRWLTIAPMPGHLEIASRANTTRETVSRTIRSMEERGLMKRSGKNASIAALDSFTVVST